MGAAGMLREYGRLKRTVERCMEQLDEEEQLVLEMMYIVPKNGNLEKLCQEFEVEKSAVYRRRDRALERFSVVLAAQQAGMSAGRQIRNLRVKWGQMK